MTQTRHDGCSGGHHGEVKRTRIASLVEPWTIEDAARELHPPMTVEQVRALVTLAGLQPIGKKPPGPYGGRPAKVYDASQVRIAHAIVARLLIGQPSL